MCVPINLGRFQVAEDVLQNAAVAVVLHLIRRIDAAEKGDVLRTAVLPDDAARHIHAGLDAVLDAGDFEHFRAVEA